MVDRRLGRGLESLISRTANAADRQIHELPLEAVHPNPNQPRQSINEAALEGLARSIQEHGVLQPIVVRRTGAEFEVVAGERRLRASKIAGRATIPALVVEAEEARSFELALIENIQRENLSALEEAEAFQEILTATALTQQQLADRLGRSRAGVANSLRLLELPEEAKQLLRSGALSAGQAKVLLGSKSVVDMIMLASETVRRGWSVRELEKQVRSNRPVRLAGTRKGKGIRRFNMSNYEEQLRIIYGTKIRFEGSQDRGRIAFEYYSPTDLGRLLTTLLSAGLAEDPGRSRRSAAQLPAAGDPD